MKQIPSFIIILVPFHFSEVHFRGPKNYRIMLEGLFGFTVIKEMTVFFHRVVVTLNNDAVSQVT